MSDSSDDLVAAQYEKWSYPEPVSDLAAISFNSPDEHYKDLKELYWAYWPCAPYRDDLDILVAGCGTMAAACYAYLYPQARVVGIDVSGSSLGHEEFLKKKHGLANLTLRQCPVEEASSLGEDFDFIATHGVLHHLADPAAGLRVLGRLLRPDGVIAIMVYARYGRVGVYMLQDLFRLLGLTQTSESVQVVKEAIQTLSPEHPVQRYLRLALDLRSVPGLVDTFLHQRDKCYTVLDCLDLVREGGVNFQGWDENSFYYPDAQIAANHPFFAHVSKLHGPALWQAMELFYGCLPGHFFYACRSDRASANYQIEFEGASFLGYIPVARVSQRGNPDPLRGQPATLARPPFPPIALDNWQARVFHQIDGQRSVRTCLQDTGLDPNSPAILDFARAFLRSLWRVGYVIFRKPPGSAAAGSP